MVSLFTEPLPNEITMSRNINTLDELFVDELRDLYDAEHQLLKALPKMARAADHENLRTGFDFHLEQTKRQIERLERVFELAGEPVKAKTCEAMKGLIAESEEWIAQKAAPVLKDTGIIIAAQKIEHYEISGYGSVRTLAEILGHSEAVDLLQQTLDEEKETDEKLSEITEDMDLVSKRADQNGQPDDTVVPGQNLSSK
jgi:ferritin-like metal-binding protein YciE